MLNRLNATQKGILIATAGFAAFVVSDSASKWLAQSYSVFQVVAWIYTFALLFCLLGSPFLGGINKTLRTTKLKFHLARGLSNFGLAVSVVYAFQNLPLTSVYPILFLAPFVMTVLAGFFYKEQIRPIDWIVIGLGFSGVLIAFRPGFEIIDPWLFVAFLTMLFIAAFGLFASLVASEDCGLKQVREAGFERAGPVASRTYRTTCPDARGSRVFEVSAETYEITTIEAGP